MAFSGFLADDFCAGLKLEEDGELFYGEGDFVTVV